MSGAEMPCPDDLARIPNPRIGYVGRVNPKIDFEGVAEVANLRPDWHWVFVGAVGIGGASSFEQSPRHQEGFERVRQCRNVHFLGVKDHKEVPAYLNHMNVNVLHYSGWGTTGHPTKLYEYFAAGKPIVATDYEGIRRFSNVIDLVTSPTEWLEAIELALTTGGVGTVADRQTVALESTWDRRCDQLESWLLEVINGRMR
jgi:glycosyltransferase involved in cell wall biosynthesis